MLTIQTTHNPQIQDVVNIWLLGQKKICENLAKNIKKYVVLSLI